MVWSCYSQVDNTVKALSEFLRYGKVPESLLDYCRECLEKSPRRFRGRFWEKLAEQGLGWQAYKVLYEDEARVLEGVARLGNRG